MIMKWVFLVYKSYAGNILLFIHNALLKHVCRSLSYKGQIMNLHILS